MKERQTVLLKVLFLIQSDSIIDSHIGMGFFSGLFTSLFSGTNTIRRSASMTVIVVDQISTRVTSVC